MAINDFTIRAGGTNLVLPVPPVSFKISGGNLNQTVNIIDGKELNIPGGMKLCTVSWDSFFPCRDYTFLRSKETDPWKLVKYFEDWSASKTKIRLIIGGSPFNKEFLIETFTYGMEDGGGDIYYGLTLKEYRDFTVPMTKQPVTGNKPPANPPIDQPANKKTYTVKKGDSMWAICQSQLGKGSRYPELYALNKAVIDAGNKKYGNSKYTIYPGQVLTLPSK